MVRMSRSARFGAVAILTLAALGTVLLVLTLIDARARHARTLDQVRKLETVASQRTRLEDEIRQLETRKAQDTGLFLQAPSPAQASAALQDHLQKIIRARGSRIASTQVLDTPDADELFPISVRIRFTCEIEALQTILYALDTGRPLTLIDSVSVEPDRNLRRFRAEVPGQDQSLAVTMTVRAFRAPSS